MFGEAEGRSRLAWCGPGETTTREARSGEPGGNRTCSARPKAEADLPDADLAKPRRAKRGVV